MRFVLFESIDITERVIDVSRESATWNNIDGLIAPVKDVVLFNSDGAYSPNSQTSIIAGSAYRNKLIETFDDNDNLIYKGLISSIDESVDGEGRNTVTIHSRDALGSFLEWPVRATSSISGINTNLARVAGNNTIQIPSTIAIPANCVVSTSLAFVPSYQVTDVIVSGLNQTLTLDRGLEKDLPNNTPLYFSVPQTTTIPQALADAFFTPLAYYGLTNLIGNSFNDLHIKELALGHTIRLFIRSEEEINLSKHVGKLLEIGDYFITRSDNGVFELVEKLAYNGEVILDEISDAEIMIPVDEIDDRTRLLFGFSMLYVAGNTVKKLDYDIETGYGIGAVPQYEPGLTPDLIEEYGATKVFKPIAANSSTLSGYNYLYSNEETAKYYGLKKLNYCAFPRIQYKFSVKPFISGQPEKTINMSYFKAFLLNLTVNESKIYSREPIKITAYEKDKTTGEYKNVIVELTNKPKPGLTVN